MSRDEFKFKVTVQEKKKRPTFWQYFYDWKYINEYFVYRTIKRFAWQNEHFIRSQRRRKRLPLSDSKWKNIFKIKDSSLNVKKILKLIG